MTGGQEAFLIMAIVAFLCYIGLLAYGVAVASTRPDERAADEPARKGRANAGNRAAPQAH